MSLLCQDINELGPEIASAPVITSPTCVGVAVSGLSKYHFVRQYHSITGHTPMEDARFLRVAQAHHLLMNTALPLHEIGPLVGIRDEFHLSRLLKTVYGVRQSGGQGGAEV